MLSAMARGCASLLLLVAFCAQSGILTASASSASAWIKKREKQMELWKPEWRPQPQPLQDALMTHTRQHWQGEDLQQPPQRRSTKQAPMQIPGTVWGGRIVTLKTAEGQTLDRGLLQADRSLLRNGSMAVDGSVAELGYFYIEAYIGTPAKRFSLIVDTGSSITFVPCSDCARCGSYHENPFFDVDASSTVRRILCSEPDCDRGLGSYRCRTHGEVQGSCWYHIAYAEGSSSDGWMLQDVFSFPDAGPAAFVAFGCEAGEGGMIKDQQADGIMGMDRSYDSLHSQLSASGVMDDIFSLCFGIPSGGTMLLGDVAVPSGLTTAWAPLWNYNQFYQLNLTAISIAGQRLDVPPAAYTGEGFGAILDSGTTFTYIPPRAYRLFKAAIQNVARAKKLPSVPQPDPSLDPPDVCWGDAAITYEDLTKYFPSAEFNFNGVKVKMQPWQYLFRPDTHARTWCLALYENTGDSTLIGGVSMRDILVTYDVQNRRVGFTETHGSNGGCVGMKDHLEELAAVAAQTPPPPLPSVPPPSPLPPPSGRPPPRPLLPLSPTAALPPPSNFLMPPPQSQAQSPPPALLPPSSQSPPWPVHQVPPVPSPQTQPRPITQSPSLLSLPPSPPPADVPAAAGNASKEEPSTTVIVLAVLGSLIAGGAAVAGAFLLIRWRCGPRQWQLLQQQEGYDNSMPVAGLALHGSASATSIGNSNNTAVDAAGFVSRNGWPQMGSIRAPQFQLQPPLPTSRVARHQRYGSGSSGGTAAVVGSEAAAAMAAAAAAGAIFTLDDDAAAQAPVPSPQFATLVPQTQASLQSQSLTNGAALSLVSSSYQPPAVHFAGHEVELIPLVEAVAGFGDHIGDSNDLLNLNDDSLLKR